MWARSFSFRWPRVMYCRLPAKSAKASVLVPIGLQKARRPAAVLDVRTAIGAGGGQEEGVDGGEELAEIVGDLGLPFAVLELRPRSQTRLLRLDRRREHDVFGIAHGYSSFLPSWPATSWMNCQATRPERAPRVTDHSTACLRKVLDRHAELVVAGVALDHGEEGVLVGIVEAEPQAEAVGQRDFLLDRLGRIDGGRALVLDHVARHQMAAVGGGVEHDVVRPALDAAFEHRLQRLVGGVLAVEGEVVAEHHEAALGLADAREQRGQRGDVLAMDLDQRQRARRAAHLAVHMGVDGLHDRALAGAARAPQQGVVGRQALGEAPRVLEQGLLLPVDALSRSSSTRLTLGTASSRWPAACQT